MSEKETLNLGDEVSKRNLQKIDPFFQGLVAEVFNRYMWLQMHVPATTSGF